MSVETTNIAARLFVRQYKEREKKQLEAKSKANYRLVCYDGQYRVEVLDKPIGWWYIVASKLGSFDNAVKYCKEHFEK